RGDRKHRQRGVPPRAPVIRPERRLPDHRRPRTRAACPIEPPATNRNEHVMSRIARAMGTSRVPILLALILGGATFVGVLTWLPTVAGAQPSGAAEVEPASVLVAAHDLAAGAPIEGD